MIKNPTSSLWYVLGLYRAAIMESGSALMDAGWVPNPRDYAFQLGKILAPYFNGSSSVELLRILQAATPQNILKAGSRVSGMHRTLPCCKILEPKRPVLDIGLLKYFQLFSVLWNSNPIWSYSLCHLTIGIGDLPTFLLSVLLVLWPVFLTVCPDHLHFSLVILCATSWTFVLRLYSLFRIRK